jgi:hypothetical protein
VVAVSLPPPDPLHTREAVARKASEKLRAEALRRADRLLQEAAARRKAEAAAAGLGGSDGEATAGGGDVSSTARGGAVRRRAAVMGRQVRRDRVWGLRRALLGSCWAAWRCRARGMRKGGPCGGLCGWCAAARCGRDRPAIPALRHACHGPQDNPQVYVEARHAQVRLPPAPAACATLPCCAPRASCAPSRFYGPHHISRHVNLSSSCFGV